MCMKNYLVIYKNREENLKRYEELKKSVPNEDEDEDIDFWN